MPMTGLKLSKTPSAWLKLLSTLSLMLLVFALPFELNSPIFSIGPLAVTNVELLLALGLLLAVLRWWQEKPRPSLPRYWLWLFLFYGGVLLSTVLAPEHQTNSVKAALRLFSGTALALAVPQIVRSQRQLRFIVAALLAGGAIACGLGLFETFNNQPASWLTPFRDYASVVGQFVRLSGPFDYANQAAMFIEATIFFWLAWVWWLSQKNDKNWRHTAVILLLLVALLLYLEAAFQTLSRTSWAAIGLTSLIMALLIDKGSPPRRRLWLALATAVVILFGFNTAVSSVFRLRLQSEADQSWYQIQLEAPAQWQMEAQEIQQIPITIRNEGILVWQSDVPRPINLGAHWVDANSGIEYSQPRWPFPTAISPGEQASLTIPLQAPHIPGSYLLEWDIVQEEVIWFSEKNGLTTMSKVTVLASERPLTAQTYQQRFIPEKELPIPNRLVLWTVAAQLWQQRPLTGIGLDNFRLTYGQVLGANRWNETIHSNNWFLETVVSLGLLGAIPFFIWLGLLALDLWRGGRQPSVTIWQLAIIAGLLAFFIHGLLDYFLLFNATGLLFWSLVGLWLSTKQCA